MYRMCYSTFERAHKKHELDAIIVPHLKQMNGAEETDGSDIKIIIRMVMM